MRTVVVLPACNEAANIATPLEPDIGSELTPDVLAVDDSSDGLGAAYGAGLDFGPATGASYGFQIQTASAAPRTGASIADVPNLFSDPEQGESTMSRGIVVAAMIAVPRVRGRLKATGAGRTADSAVAR